MHIIVGRIFFRVGDEEIEVLLVGELPARVSPDSLVFERPWDRLSLGEIGNDVDAPIASLGAVSANAGDANVVSDSAISIFLVIVIFSSSRLAMTVPTLPRSAAMHITRTGE